MHLRRRRRLAVGGTDSFTRFDSQPRVPLEPRRELQPLESPRVEAEQLAREDAKIIRLLLEEHVLLDLVPRRFFKHAPPLVGRNLRILDRLDEGSALAARPNRRPLSQHQRLKPLERAARHWRASAFSGPETASHHVGWLRLCGVVVWEGPVAVFSRVVFGPTNLQTGALEQLGGNLQSLELWPASLSPDQLARVDAQLPCALLEGHVLGHNVPLMVCCCRLGAHLVEPRRLRHQQPRPLLELSIGVEPRQARLIEEHQIEDGHAQPVRHLAHCLVTPLHSVDSVGRQHRLRPCGRGSKLPLGPRLGLGTPLRVGLGVVRPYSPPDRDGADTTESHFLVEWDGSVGRLYH
mmetsp:Transcript_33306/g.107749  ORF Transcript_33306/g.107749 Transcript_33306/m.107749 type:complete len:350 (+) Transcript_33306:1278-2327(+)